MPEKTGSYGNYGNCKKYENYENWENGERENVLRLCGDRVGKRGLVHMSKVLMVQGTMSSVGKSLLVAGLCRIMRQDGYRVAPFKSQNMALNSFITEEGLEMGRAQVMQAEAAGIKPMVCMNPVLLKPTSHAGSQVIVNGEVLGNMAAKDYFAYKTKLVPDIKKAFRTLEQCADIIVIEGAGSPAEINLREHDIVNMGMAKLVDAPVLLVGDIDRGGVFAQLLGTLMLLEHEEKARVKALVINKFRGDRTLLDSGIAMLEERGQVPVAGIIPYMELALEDEDSLTERFEKKAERPIDIAVIRYPRISNFTDFNVFEQMPQVSVRYVTSVAGLRHPDMVILPGSKNTMADLAWMRQNGLEAAVKKRAEETPVWGICGGYQMLGTWISDPQQSEEGGTLRGMDLLPVTTELKKEKTRCRREGAIHKLGGVFSSLSGLGYVGYEIHMGQTDVMGDGTMDRNNREEVITSGSNPNVYGTYVHGIFDKGEIADAVVQALAEKKGIRMEEGAFEDYQSFKEKQYDKLADTLRRHLNMEGIYGMLREAHLE